METTNSYFTDENSTKYNANNINIFKTTSINKSKFVEYFGTDGYIDIKDNNGVVIQRIDNNTEADENGKIKVTYTNRPETFFLRLNNVEKEGIIEVENSRIILPTAIIENSAIITDVSVNGINTIKTKNVDTEKKENSAKEIEEDFIKYEYNDKITTEIKQAIEKKFNVKVMAVNITNSHPKKKRVGKYTGMTSKYKKAIVTLKKGETISFD